jgi:hypothetical protein
VEKLEFYKCTSRQARRISMNMKIFSLETKKHLVGWSIVLGFVVYFIVDTYAIFPSCGKSVTAPELTYTQYLCMKGEKKFLQKGFPLKYFEGINNEVERNLRYRITSADKIVWIKLANYLFSTLAAFIILSPIRHLKTKH